MNYKPITILFVVATFSITGQAANNTSGNSYSENTTHLDQPHSGQSHVGHSDALLILLRHKISLQKLQVKHSITASTLIAQEQHIRQVMPVLLGYMAIPKSYYLTTEMYHDSLENRAVMLTDFARILSQYQKQLVSHR
jgi:hypothetical protein